jgi:hypothetical protein
MKDDRTETLDITEARASRRIGLISLGLVTGSLVMVMGMAITRHDDNEASRNGADCQRTESTPGATRSSLQPKAGTLLICPASTGPVTRRF